MEVFIMENIKSYREMSLEEQKKVYELYQRDCEKDNGMEVYETFEDFDADAWWTDLDYDAETLEAIG